MASALLYYKKSLLTFCILIISCFLFLYQLISFITCFLLWNNIRSGILSARKWYTHLISWKSAKPRTLNRFQTNAISIQPQECTADAQESCLIIRKRQLVVLSHWSKNPVFVQFLFSRHELQQHLIKILFIMALIVVTSGLTCKQGERVNSALYWSFRLVCAFLNKGIFDSRPNTYNSHHYSFKIFPLFHT